VGAILGVLVYGWTGAVIGAAVIFALALAAAGNF
jgi:hypothetical protein